MDNEQIVRRFLGGFSQPDRLQESLELLADDYRFKNPMVELESKTAFIPLAERISGALTGLDIQRVATAGDWVSVFYIFRSAIPGLEVNPATEWFRVENGLIRESHLLYDATEWRAVYAQVEPS